MARLSTKKTIYALDNDAVLALVARYRAPLTYFAVGYLGNFFDAEDAVSEAIVKLLVKKPRLHNENALKTYLYTATKNTAIDILRKRKREKSHRDETLRLTATEFSYIDDELGTTQERHILLTALHQLKTEYRQVLYFYYFEEISLNQICKILGKNKKQIYNLLNRAKTALAKLLRKEGLLA